jgi:hypothetical protein
VEAGLTVSAIVTLTVSKPCPFEVVADETLGSVNRTGAVQRPPFTHRRRASEISDDWPAVSRDSFICSCSFDMALSPKYLAASQMPLWHRPPLTIDSIKEKAFPASSIYVFLKYKILREPMNYFTKMLQ